MKKKNLAVAGFAFGALILSCSNNTDNKNSKASAGIAEEQANSSKIYFSCKVNGLPLSDNTDGGILDPVTNMLLDVGENENYSVGIRIPTDFKPGETCTGCKGFVHEKINREGIVQRKIYELTQNISVTLSSRRKGYATGTFSFTVKLKEDSDKTITVTDGKFAMSITNEELGQ
jgi:hypothetical protein